MANGARPHTATTANAGTPAWKRVLRGISSVVGPLSVVAVFGAWHLSRIQQKAPKLKPTALVTTGGADAEVVEAAATRGFLPALVQEGRLAFPLGEWSAEAWELFHVIDDGRFATLLHESPVVRGYAAMHLLRTQPEKVAKLKPLLGDRAELTVRGFDDEPAVTATVAEQVVAMMCAMKDKEPLVAAFLHKVDEDWKLLALHDATRRCFEPSPRGED